MSFHALDRAIELVEAVAPLTRAIGRENKAIAEQLQRAAISVPLNVAEGAQRNGGDREYHYRVAAGSNAEARTALRIAAALGDVDASAALALADRVAAMLWRLTHRR